MNTLWARGKINMHVMHGHSARAQSCTPVTRRGSSVETPWSPSGHCDVFFTEILRRFQKFHNALITLWERYLEWQGPNQFSVMYFYGVFFIPVAISFILCLQLSGVFFPLNTLHTLRFVKDLAVKKGENLVISSIRICDIACDCHYRSVGIVHVYRGICKYTCIYETLS